MMKIGSDVPWNAGWTGENRFEIRPCRWAEGRLALWQPHKPGEGRPMFAEPHIVRQRRSIAQLLCTVCGEHTPENDRWWFEHGHERDGFFMTTESPVHRHCADHALRVCPNLRKAGQPPRPFPANHSVLCAVMDPGALVMRFDLASRSNIVGQMKIAWPASRVVRASK